MKTRSFPVFLAALLASVAVSASLFRQVGAQRRSAMKTKDAMRFKVRIENISNPDGFTASNGVKWPFAISPGAFTVRRGAGNPLFTVGAYAGEALRSQAEDGNPDLLVKIANHHAGVRTSGVFNTPEGAMRPGPVGPGGAYEFEVMATPNARLFFTFMFGQSNDLFYGPRNGIPLFDTNGRPATGDITSQVGLWDAGTEVNEEPGIGPNQAPRQPAPHTGPREHELIGPVQDAFTYPNTGEVLRITITPEGGM